VMSLALKDALKTNMSLTKCSIVHCDDCSFVIEVPCEIVRNRDLHNVFLALKLLARPQLSAGFGSLVQLHFRQAILDFFMIPGCGAHQVMADKSTPNCQVREEILANLVPKLVGGLQTVDYPTVTDDAITHDEPAAVVDPQEAHAVVGKQWESAVEYHLPNHSNSSTAEAPAEHSHSENSQDVMFLLHFARDPLQMHLALEEGLPLRACRRNMEAAGFPWRLPTGAYIFVPPSQYRQVMAALNCHVLHKSHVVIAESLEYLLEETLLSVTRGAWVKFRTPLELPCESLSEMTAASQGLDRLYQPGLCVPVKHGFLHEQESFVSDTLATQSEPGDIENPRLATCRLFDW